MSPHKCLSHAAEMLRRFYFIMPLALYDNDIIRYLYNIYSFINPFMIDNNGNIDIYIPISQ